jgi:hypothetical protein
VGHLRGLTALFGAGEVTAAAPVPWLRSGNHIGMMLAGASSSGSKLGQPRGWRATALRSG